MDAFQQVPQQEDIDLLYSLLRQNPNFLHRDNNVFADTPLHWAARNGRTSLAYEILRLIPSFGQKKNPDGYTPLEMALRGGHLNTVKAMMKLDPKLVGLKGREGITLLHWAAAADDGEILMDGLFHCPNLIGMVTIRGETTIHVAVKEKKLEAVRVLLRWLEKEKQKGVLRWGDWEGNNVLHLATSSNQIEVMKLLMREEPHLINDKNLEGLTALDLEMRLPPDQNGTALRILRKMRAKNGASIPGLRISTVAHYLSSPLNIRDKIRKQLSLSNETRSAILVVAILVATAAFQSAHSPPGGFGQQPLPSNNATSIAATDHTNGAKEMMDSKFYNSFTLCNSLALATSVGTLFMALPAHKSNVLLYASLVFMTFGYSLAIQATSRSTSAINLLISIVPYMVIAMAGILKVSVENYMFLERLAQILESDALFGRLINVFR